MPSEETNPPVESAAHEANPPQYESTEPVDSFTPPSPTLEDRPAEPVTPLTKPVEEKPVPRKESWFVRAVRWVLTCLLFLVIGAAAVYLTLTVDANRKITALQAEATASANQIATLEAQMKTAQQELASDQTAIQNGNDQLAAMTLKLAVYKMKTDVNTIRVALLKLDTITARQALAASRQDLADLVTLKVDASTLDGFTKRLDNTGQLLSTDPQKAMLELDNLIDNLYLLESNLK